MMKTFERLVGKDHRFAERRDQKRRPLDSVLVEFVLLGYPVLAAPPLPDEDEAGDEPAARPAGLRPVYRLRSPVYRPPEMSDPLGTMTGLDNQRHPS
jgi:hypothetical protein